MKLRIFIYLSRRLEMFADDLGIIRDKVYGPVTLSYFKHLHTFQTIRTLDYIGLYIKCVIDIRLLYSYFRIEN